MPQKDDKKAGKKDKKQDAEPAADGDKQKGSGDKKPAVDAKQKSKK